MRVTASYPAKRLRTEDYVAWIAAGMLVVMLLLQLFMFESFPDVLAVVLGVSVSLATVLAAVVVALELFALPYLLAMKLSPLFRVFSMAACCTVAVFWLATSLVTTEAENSGIFGATLMLEGGITPICWSILLAGLVGYTVQTSPVKLPRTKK